MADIGLYGLRIALVVTAAGIGAGIYAGVARQPSWTRVAERAVILVFAFVSVAMIALFHALAVGDYQLAYVLQNSSTTMPLQYRLASLWGGQSGSLLLWAWMLGLYAVSAVWANRSQNRTLMPWVCVSILANMAFFLVLTNFVSNPFERVAATEVVSDGRGLNPLLQHPLMTIHPLLLYAGFTGFVIPFSFAFAAMVTGELGTSWFRTTRRWTLFAWSVLAAGLMLGGRWAYEVLGWGGYWAWDPVENASLMPWIAGTAYLHSVMIQEKRDMLKTWNLVLIGLTYSLCLFGTFLTRSGVVQSVHSFTNSGWFGMIFLAYVVVIAGVFFGALLYRRKDLASTKRLESVVSREAGFLFNNWVFMTLLVVVLCGTILPVITEGLTGERAVVGPGYFNRLAGPLALFLLLLTGIGPLIAWRRATLASVRRQFVLPGLVGVVAAVTFGTVFWGEIGFYPIACWSLSAFTVATITQEYWRAASTRVRKRGESPFRAVAELLRRNQRRYGGYIVHFGTVLILVGIAGSVFNEERLENIQPGDSLEISRYRLEYRTANPIPAQHYGGAVARIALYEGDKGLAVMTPEKRMYWEQEQPTSIPSIYSTLREDLYITLTAIEQDGSATLKIHRNPLVNVVWTGGLIFVLGTIACMWPHPERGVTAR